MTFEQTLQDKQYCSETFSRKVILGWVKDGKCSREQANEILALKASAVKAPEPMVLAYATVIRESEKAIQVSIRIGGKSSHHFEEMWLPKSQIKMASDDLPNGIYLSPWIVEQKFRIGQYPEYC
ncbi:MAG: hypothetical protein KGJ13_07925 [Patescibacteria group bacterium]|nr:hypothetical protein [Patescibacteria group bacterium]